MRFAPRSLFSRLVLVLLGGLVVAQLASFAVHMHERGELLSQASGMQAARRIADVVQLLDTMAVADRRRIVQVLNAPPLAVSLDQRPLAAEDVESGFAAQAALFGTLLRRYVGEGRAIAVRVTDAPVSRAAAADANGPRGPEWHGGRMGMKGGWHGDAQRGLSFVAQVALRDGTLVTFAARQPVQTRGWPVRMLASLALLLTAVIVGRARSTRWPMRRTSWARTSIVPRCRKAVRSKSCARRARSTPCRRASPAISGTAPGFSRPCLMI
jgi:hypothetical protein